MEISTLEAWLEEVRQFAYPRDSARPEFLPYYSEDKEELDKQRSELLEQFPFTVVATGNFHEHDSACRWCWQNIGPAHGPCSDWQSEYPACPLVLETKRVDHGVSLDKDGKEYAWKRTRYTNPGDHRHEGDWTFLWIDKVDYNFGYGEYFFAKDTDRARFVSALPAFTWSEAWDENR